MKDVTLKYNWNVAGHISRLKELEVDLQSDNVSHAYLFAGPEQIGKFTIAKNLAHILQCENNFCHQCPTCLQVEKGYHSDTIEMIDDGVSLKIEQIREILDRLNMSTQSRYKILLIQNIERMTTEAANALLKTLEDPPPRVIFLLTTSNIRELLATMISRVRLYKFDHLAEPDLRAFLQQTHPVVGLEEMDAVIALALGKVGKALSLMENTELLSYSRKMYNDVGSFLQKNDRVEQFATIAEVMKDEKVVKDFLDVFLAISRYELLKKVEGQSSSKEAEKAHDQAKILKLIHLIKTIQETQEMLKKNVNTRLALENLILAV